MNARPLLLVSVLLSAGVMCSADDSPAAARTITAVKSPGTTNQPPSASLNVVKVKSFEGAFGDLGSQAVLTVGENKLRFHTPTGWLLRQQSDGPGLGYTLSQSASPGKISLVIDADAARMTNGYSHQALRPQALRQYKDARIVAEYTTAALGSNNALVFDLALPLSGEPWMSRVVFFRCPVGEIQVSMVAPKDQSSGTANAMMSMISSMEFRKANEAFQVIKANPGL